VELVEAERVAVRELVAVVGGEGVVDAGAQEHGAAGRGAFAFEVVAAPVLRFSAPPTAAFPLLTGQDDQQRSAPRGRRRKGPTSRDAPTNYENNETEVGTDGMDPARGAVAG
jgi:hypothetical protein